MIIYKDESNDKVAISTIIFRYLYNYLNPLFRAHFASVVKLKNLEQYRITCTKIITLKEIKNLLKELNIKYINAKKYYDTYGIKYGVLIDKNEIEKLLNLAIINGCIRIENK